MNTTSETAVKRFKALRKSMSRDGLGAFAISHLPTIRYFTNFTGSSATVVVTSNAIHFFTDDRYDEQVKMELFKLPSMKVHITRSPWALLAEKKLLAGCGTMGFESSKVSVDTAKSIAKALKGIKLVPAATLAYELTLAKSDEEVACIQRAADITKKTYDYILGFVRPGMKERDVVLEISYHSKKLGSEDDAFDIIFVAGEHSAWIHGRAGERKLKKGDIITLDFGCTVKGFHSDMTRTFVLGKATAEMKKLYGIISEAHRAGIESLAPNVLAKSVDLATRAVIERAGYEKYFTHSTGHGLGIEVHELPSLSNKNLKGIVPANSVVTIEPGIYLPGKFGMRLEDDIHVTSGGNVSLTTARRDLVEL